MSHFKAAETTKETTLQLEKSHNVCDEHPYQ